MQVQTDNPVSTPLMISSVFPRERESGFWNPESESWALESGKQHKEFESQNGWNAKSKFYWQRLEFSTWNPESLSWSPQSKSVLVSYSWLATKWQGGHVEGQYNETFSRRIYMKIELSSQRREMLLFLTTNMAAVTSRAIKQYGAKCRNSMNKLRNKPWDLRTFAEYLKVFLFCFCLIKLNFVRNLW